MPDVVSFAEALERVPPNVKKHVLLGNGFSRACRDDIFSYDALFDQANFNTLSPTARAAFDALTTTDFEVVMRALRQAAALAQIYAQNDPRLPDRLRADADSLRDLLAETIAHSHPDRPGDIELVRYAACRLFLNHFKTIYTVSYDLLLYWALMQEELEPALNFDDGFRQPEDGPVDYVTWDVQNTQQQSVFYLHGALHIFDAGPELQKFTWSNTGVALIEQIREALRTDRFPLFVAEGDSRSKLDRIQHNGFLNRAYRSFSSIGGALFIFGLSFAENDEHILKLVYNGKITHLLVSLHGDPDSEGNQRIVRRAELMGDRGRRRLPLQVTFFDAASVRVWG